MTEATKREIQEVFSDGTFTAYEIAAAYNVSYTMVLKAVGERLVKARIYRDNLIKKRDRRALKFTIDREANMNVPPLQRVDIINKYNAMGDRGTPSFGERLSVALKTLR